MRIRHEAMTDYAKERYGKMYRLQWSHNHDKNKKLYYFYALSDDTTKPIYYVTAHEVAFNTYEIVAEREVQINI